MNAKLTSLLVGALVLASPLARAKWGLPVGLHEGW